MKIVFICGSLEPGRDGVGDYTRRLAAALIQKNNAASIIAMNDKYITEKLVGTQKEGETILPVLRLPANSRLKTRLVEASNCIHKFGPDWVSLQFVSFGYHKYGLPFELIFSLRRILKNKKLHIMFHELWCGMGKQPPGKERFLGFIQKVFFRLMISVLKPDAIFTNTKSYAAHLRQIGANARVVPVFSNIKTNDSESSENLNRLLPANLLSDVVNNQSDWLIIGFFGTIYPVIGLAQLIKNVAEAGENCKKKVGILSFGVNRYLDINKIVDLNRITLWKLGELSSGLVNQIMSLVDVGIVTSPADQIDKSGSAIAWLERGIPVLISGADETYCKEQKSEGILQVNTFSDVLEALTNTTDNAIQNRLNNAVASYLNFGKTTINDA